MQTFKFDFRNIFKFEFDLVKTTHFFSFMYIFFKNNFTKLQLWWNSLEEVYFRSYNKIIIVGVDAAQKQAMFVKSRKVKEVKSWFDFSYFTNMHKHALAREHAHTYVCIARGKTAHHSSRAFGWYLHILIIYQIKHVNNIVFLDKYRSVV